MDAGDQIQLIIKGKNGYLLVEEASSKLRLPFWKLGEDEDFHSAAQMCLKEVISFRSIAIVIINYFFSSGCVY